MVIGKLLAVEKEMSLKMNSGIKYIGIFCVSVLSASLLIPPTAHAEECTNPDSNGHCYKVPNPPNRRSRTADKNKEEFSDELRQYFLSKNYTIDSISESGGINVYNDLYIINVGPIYKRDNSYTGKWMISIYYNNILTTLNL